MHTPGSDFSSLLIENNPYDRAVLDALFEEDRRADLQYNLGGKGVTQVGPSDLWSLCTTYSYDLVLLDLALTNRCGEVISSSAYRADLGARYGELSALDLSLSKWSDECKPFLIEGTLALTDLYHFGEEAVPYAQTVLNERMANGRDLTELRVVEECIQRGVEDFSTVRESLGKLWGCRPAETVLWLSRAPSILRIFAIIASFPDVCFGVVSHYADRDTNYALRKILGFRNRCPKERHLENILNGLILNKAALLNLSSAERSGSLVAQLRDAAASWRRHQSPRAVVAPFGEFLVVSPSGENLRLSMCVEREWPKVFFSTRKTCVVLWDETGLIVGRKNAWRAGDNGQHRGWTKVLRRDVPWQGVDMAPGGELPNPDLATCFVVNAPLDHDAADDFGFDLETRLASVRSMVFVGGDSRAREAFERRIGGTGWVSLYRVPDWKADVWRTKPRMFGRTILSEALTAAVEDLVVQWDGSHVSFCDAVEGLSRDRKICQKIAAELEKDVQVERWELFESSAAKILNALKGGSSLKKALINVRLVPERDPVLNDG